MIEEMAKKAGRSVWRKVGEEAVVTAVTTLLSEAIKASVELVKKAKLREQKAEFDDRREREKKARDPDGSRDDDKNESRDADQQGADRDDQPDDAELDEDRDDETDAAESDKPAANGGPRIDFQSYVASNRD